jgi:hypothetical protein
MDIRSHIRGGRLGLAVCAGVLFGTGTSLALTFSEFVDPNPAAGNSFGATVVALSTGNVVITSQYDDAGGNDAGAVYLFNGATGALISTLRGSTAGDNIGSRGVTALSNGNFVVISPSWDNGAISDAGAVTWGSGTIGVSGVVSAANSLVGSTAGDLVDALVTALSNGNYVVESFLWNNGAITDAGAATWGSGTSGVSGVISAANSLVGSTANDIVGSVTALSNGNYVVRSPNWDNGAVANAGAATWGSGTSGVSGVISAANSLVGSNANDVVGNGEVTALSNGNFVVTSSAWDNVAIVDAGAATWGNGTSGVNGVISAANSLVGSTASDQVGIGGVTALSNGNYVVRSYVWDNGGVANAGAATWGSGTSGTSGVISAANSLVGAAAFAQLRPIIVDEVNTTFFAPFISEVGGHVRVGPVDNPPVIVSAVDIPNDQGGWLCLTFIRSILDDVSGSPAVATYGVWRHIPSTTPMGARSAIPSEPLDARAGAVNTKALRAAVPAGFDVQEVNGRFYATGLGSRAPGNASAFPPGTWELVTSVPALQLVQYVAAVPTTSNAVVNDFVVTAHTTTPSIWYVSDPVSGQSVDNLAPAPPTQLNASYSGGQTNLQWAANTEHDLGSYHLHRGTAADFTPTLGNRIAAQISTSYADVGPPGGYYKLSALDVNGNESGFVLLTPNGVTAVEGGSAVAFSLEGVRPNPAKRDRLTVAFALPTGAAARLDLLDISGRRVLLREVGSLGAGRHTVNLSEGRAVASGVYWVRLTQGENRQTARVQVVE